MCCARKLTFTIVVFHLCACLGHARGPRLVAQMLASVASAVVSQNAGGASQLGNWRSTDFPGLKAHVSPSTAPFAVNRPEIQPMKGVLNATQKLKNSPNRIDKIDGSGGATKKTLPSLKLDREDQAKTQMLRVPPQRPDSKNNASVGTGGLVEKSVRGASLEHPARMGITHDIGEFTGQPLIIVFYRGMGCLHCVDQLSLFATHRKAVEQTGVKLVAIGSDSKEKLRKALASYGDDDRAPFLFLADENHDVFKGYGCFGSEPLHGIFMIDAGRGMCWHNIAESPFMDIDQIISRSRQLGRE